MKRLSAMFAFLEGYVARAGQKAEEEREESAAKEDEPAAGAAGDSDGAKRCVFVRFFFSRRFSAVFPKVFHVVIRCSPRVMQVASAAAATPAEEAETRRLLRRGRQVRAHYAAAHRSHARVLRFCRRLGPRGILRGAGGQGQGKAFFCESYICCLYH